MANRILALKKRIIENPLIIRILTFLMVLGPGLIVMEADNDAGAVSAYTQAGAIYGTKLFWLLLLLLPITYLAQEMVIRLALSTGKGHAALIYEKFGKFWGRYSITNLHILNFLTLLTEFAALAMIASALSLPAWAVMIPAVLFLNAIILSGSYFSWEKIAILLCVCDASWLAFSYKFGLNGADLKNAVIPALSYSGSFSNLIFMIIAIVGTTIAPWQLFFQQSCIVDKKLEAKNLADSRLDTMIGAVFTILVAGGMMYAGALLKAKGIAYSDPAQMARDLGATIGVYWKNLLLLLFANSAILGTMAISLASSWAHAEVMEKPGSLNLSFKDGKSFYFVYILATLAAALVVSIPHIPLQAIIIGVQIFAGLVLPTSMIFLQLLLQDKKLISPEFQNKKWNNVVNWGIIGLLSILSIVLIIQMIFFPG